MSTKIFQTMLFVDLKTLERLIYTVTLIIKYFIGVKIL